MEAVHILSNTASQKRARVEERPARQDEEMGEEDPPAPQDVEMGEGHPSRIGESERVLASQRQLQERLGGGRWASRQDFTAWLAENPYEGWRGEEWGDYAEWCWNQLNQREQQDCNTQPRGVWEDEAFQECIKAAKAAHLMQARH